MLLRKVALVRRLLVPGVLVRLQVERPAVLVRLQVERLVVLVRRQVVRPAVSVRLLLVVSEPPHRAASVVLQAQWQAQLRWAARSLRHRVRFVTPPRSH